MRLLFSSAAEFFRQAYCAVTDFGFYRSIFQQSFVRSLLYFLALNFVVSVSLAAVQTWTRLPAIHNFVDWGARNLPPLTIQNGRRIANPDEPILKRYFGDEIVTFVYTSGSEQEVPEWKAPAVIFKEDEISIKMDSFAGTWSWGDVEQGFRPLIGVLSRPYEWPDQQHWIAWIFFPMAMTSHWLFLQILGSMQALLLMMCSASSAASLGVRLPYREYFTIAVYSLTPGLVLHLFVASVGQGGTLFDFIYLGVAAVYTYFATHSCIDSP